MLRPLAVRRGAFTLIELLVVIGIISVLIALTLPAVQRVRESANQTQCLNNLKQMGVALQAYEGVHKVFPPGYLFISSSKAAPPNLLPGPNPRALDSNFWIMLAMGIPYQGIDTAPGWGWGAYLLPYIEQSTIEQRIDYQEYLDLPKYDTLRTTRVPIYECPSDYRTGIFTVLNEFNSPLCDAYTNSYAACHGTGADIGEQADNGTGVFFRNSKIRFSDIVDGTSSTLAIGERAALFCRTPWAGAVSRGSARTTDGAPVYLAAVEEAPTQVMARTGKHPLKDPYSTPYDFFSGHPQCVNFLFCDGSVRRLTSATSPATMAALATRAQADIVGDDGY